ncbi:MAG: DnaJ domain-containing protein [Candidatus Kapabacteria bacterium]|nr:DnaJ domain-containing protein [Candidatus Kapabacteria bacterium]
MGQILNRIFKIAKSYINSESDLSSANRIIGGEDEELKRIIDELNQDKQKQTSDQKSQSQDKQWKDADLSIDKAYEILGLKKDASIDDIKSAYKQKIKDYHPDRVATLGEELRNLAAKKTIEINKAYELIKKHKGFN